MKRSGLQRNPTEIVQIALATLRLPNFASHLGGHANRTPSISCCGSSITRITSFNPLRTRGVIWDRYQFGLKIVPVTRIRPFGFQLRRGIILHTVVTSHVKTYTPTSKMQDAVFRAEFIVLESSSAYARIVGTRWQNKDNRKIKTVHQLDYMKFCDLPHFI